jgi:hypothetical protein
MTKLVEQESCPNYSHPLEGKHLVFHYREMEHGVEDEFLAVYRLVNGQLKELVGTFAFGTDLGQEIDDRTIAGLKRDGISEVTTVHFYNDHFFGIPRGWMPTEGDDLQAQGEAEGLEIEDWLEMNPLYTDSDYYSNLLKDNGINVVHYFGEETDTIAEKPQN